MKKWIDYLETRKMKIRDSELAKENWISEGSFLILKEAFDRIKHRDTSRIQSSKVIDMHSTFAKAYQYRVPLHPKNLSQIVHPH